MTGVLEVGQRLPIGQVIDDLALIAEASDQNDWDGKVEYLPL